MDYEFDKEIDALLRQTAQGETVFESANPKSQIPNPKSLHLDADEISVFAENVLPEVTRQRYARHLADCDACRKSLSSLIRLNSATENVAATRAEEKHSVAATAPIPWYRKLFASPNLAYTLGALVLVFSGIAAYTVLQNVNNPESTEVSQISERQPSGKGMSSDGDAPPAESYSSNMTSSANTMMSNSAASMNSSSSAPANFSNPALPLAPTAAMNSNAAAMMQKDSDKSLRAEAKSLAPPKEAMESAGAQDSIAAAAAPTPLAKENDSRFDAETQRQQPNQTQNSIAQNQTQVMPDSRNVQQRAPMPTTLSTRGKSKKILESKDDKQERSNEPISVGGKTFKRENNVWYDSAYRGQPTTNVTRGTNEYKKLDASLRGIAESLGGTAVVVWKQKAYRIQ